MEISTEKTKLITMQWHPEGNQEKGQKLDTLTSLKYLGAVVLDDGLTPEVLRDFASHCSTHKTEGNLEG